MFGITPAYGFYVRHARGISFDDVEVSFEKDDARPAFVLDDVKNAWFSRVGAELSGGAKMFSLRNVAYFTYRDVRGMDDGRVESAENKEF